MSGFPPGPAEGTSAWTVTTSGVSKTLVPGELCIVTANSINLTLPISPPLGSECAAALANGVSTFSVLPPGTGKINRFTAGTVPAVGADYNQNAAVRYVYIGIVNGVQQWMCLGAGGGDAGLDWTVNGEAVFTGPYAQFQAAVQFQGQAFPTTTYTVAARVSRVFANGTFTVTINPATLYPNNAGNQITVTNIGTGVITVALSGTGAIQGPTSIPPACTVIYELRTSDGTNGNLSAMATYAPTTRGTATITAAATSIVVNHGLTGAPDIGDIVVNLTANTTAAVGDIWISGVSATQFTINVAVAPGASTAVFRWSATLRPV